MEGEARDRQQMSGVCGEGGSPVHVNGGSVEAQVRPPGTLKLYTFWVPISGPKSEKHEWHIFP